MLNFDIIERIDELKKPRGWSYNELGEQAEINPNTIYGWKNRNIIPKLTQLEKIAAAFDLTLDEFFCGINAKGLTEEERDVLNRWSLLSEKEKDAVYYLMDTFELIRGKNV